MNTRLANLFFVSALAMGIVSPAMAGDSFTIKGFIPGIADSTKVTLVNVDGADPKMIAEVITTDGNFSFSNSVDMPSMCMGHRTKRSMDLLVNVGESLLMSTSYDDVGWMDKIKRSGRWFTWAYVWFTF